MLKIRRVIPAEADSLSQIALSAKAHWGYPKHWMELWTPELTFSAQYFEENESWAAEVDDSPIAFYTLQDKNGKAWLENLWITPEYIGKGVGKQLFNHAINRSRDLGYQTLQLEAEPNAIGFYEKMGMYTIGEHQYELDGQPRILPLMEMNL